MRSCAPKAERRNRNSRVPHLGTESMLRFLDRENLIGGNFV